MSAICPISSAFAGYREIFDPASTSSPVSLAVHLFFVNGGRKAVVVRVTSADRRGKSRANSKNVIGDADARTGIHALRDDEPLGLLLTPDAAEMSGSEAKAITKSVLKLCEKHRAFCILDVPRGMRSKHDRIRAVADWAKQSGAIRHPNAAVYFPRISIPDLSGKTGSVLVSPSGAVAGVYARTDAERGVWKAPAGLEAYLHGVEGTEIELTDEEMDLLQRASINPLRRIEGRRIVPWGARTFQPAESDSEWRYVPVRRLALFIEESLYQGLAWAVFEPNGDSLWRDGSFPSYFMTAPGLTSFDPITLERGITHDTTFEHWAALSYSPGGDAAISLRNFRKDMRINLLNQQGTIVLSYMVYRCWVAEYQALPELDANANEVAIEKVVLQHEGFERDRDVTEPKET